MMKAAGMILSLVALATTAAAQQAQQSPGATGNAMSLGVMQNRTATTPGEALYVEKCAMCHRQMGMGTVILGRRVDPAQAMLEDRRDLTQAYVAAAVRSGIGNMPRISRGEVSDPQLETIAAYLARSRK